MNPDTPGITDESNVRMNIYNTEKERNTMKKNIVRRFTDFIRNCFKEYDKTIRYGAEHNMLSILYGPFHCTTVL